MFRSITWRIATAFIILIVISIIVLSIYFYYIFKNNYINNLRTQLTNQALLVAEHSALYMSGAQAGDIDVLAEDLGDTIDVRVTIIAANGTVLGDSEEDPATMENHEQRPEFIDAMTLGTGSSTRYSQTLGCYMLYIAVPIQIGSEIEGVARVALPLTEIEGYLGQVKVTIVWVSFIASIATVILAFVITRITTRSVKELTVMSKKMAQGELDQKIVVTSRDEVGALAGAFNTMAARLRELVAAITAERDKISIILSHMGDGILVTDAEGNIIAVNKAAEGILGIVEEKAMGRPFIEAVRDYELNHLLGQCLFTRRQQTGSVEIERQGRFISVIATPFIDQPGCLLLLQDLTNVRQLQTVRRDFISNISHELRTPLASLKAIAETLEDGAIKDVAIARDFLNKMNKEIDKLTQIVQELNDLSRIESGKVPLEKIPFRISGVVDRAIERLSTQADRAGLSMISNVEVDLPQVAGDRDRIEQVLINLIHNSIKFTAEGGSISIDARTDKKNVTVSVSDTGAGISIEDLQRIFERFYKVDKARSGGGTGLGLAIAKHIVEAHGGRIWAESIKGQGSTFYFTLPLASIKI